MEYKTKEKKYIYFHKKFWIFSVSMARLGKKFDFRISVSWGW